MAILDSARLTPSVRFNLPRLLIPAIIYFGLLACATLLNGPLLFGLFIAMGLTEYRLYFPLHEAAHRLLFRERRLNDFAGTVLASLLFTSFPAFRNEHIAHHTHLGTERDPGAADYRFALTTRWQLVRFLLAPLAGGTLLGKITNLLGHRERAGSGALAMVKAMLPTAAIQLAIAVAVCVPRMELWRYPVLAVLPFVTIFLFLSRMRMFLEHGTLSNPSQGATSAVVARTFTGYGWDSWLLSGYSFRFHYEHHKQPTIPGSSLAEVHANNLLRTPKEEVCTSYRAALGDLWRTLK